MTERPVNPLFSTALWLPAALASIFLLIIAQFSFLFFHTLAEFFSIIVSFVMFAFAWSTRRFIRNNFLLFLACGYFWVGALDLLHTLTYRGMQLLDEHHTHDDIAIQFWIGTRYLEALILLYSPFAARQKIRGKPIFFLFACISLIITVLVFNDLFPRTFIDGEGLTDFKIYSEYLIDLILLAALISLFRCGEGIRYREKQLIAASIVMTMLAELAFTFYVSVYGLSNIVGHLFKLASYWLIFNAIVISNIKKPYSELLASERRFRRLFENNEVALWNVDLSGVHGELENLRKRGVTNLRQHLYENREIAPALADTIHITDINTASLELFSAESDLDPRAQSEQLMRTLPMSMFVEQLCAIWERQPNIRHEVVFRNVDNEELAAIVSFQIPETILEYANVPVSVVDITQRKQDEQKIWRQANFDQLTGLANRNYFTDSLSHTIDLAERQGDKFALLYIDLDRFKQVNDTLGHSMGDKLLNDAAKRLKENSRKSDIIARLAGDEFAILLSGTGRPEVIEPLVTKLLNSLAAPYDLSGNETTISASIGIALFPEDGCEVADLLRKADSAMYKAKEDGRNNFHFFTEEIEKEALRKRQLEQDLNRAIENQEFELYYQPIETLDAEVISAEALIRWNHPLRGLVSPIEFIPFMEETSLIAPLGEWILKQACQDAMHWDHHCSVPPKVSVNISTRQFQNQNMPALVKQILTDTGLSADRLTLEITESLMIDDEDSTIHQLNSLRLMGVALSVDDFGTGYSSLSYLKKFPVSYLKIDRSFIQGLPDCQEDSALVEAILSMAESLRLQVVAEGVETSSQANYLASLKCRYIQGYWLSKPIPQNDFCNYLNTKLNNHQSRT